MLIVNQRDHAVNLVPFRVEGVRVIDLAEIEVDAGATVEVADECARGVPQFGRGGLLDQEDNWQPASGARAPEPVIDEATPAENGV